MSKIVSSVRDYAKRDNFFVKENYVFVKDLILTVVLMVTEHFSIC